MPAPDRATQIYQFIVDHVIRDLENLVVRLDELAENPDFKPILLRDYEALYDCVQHIHRIMVGLHE